MNHTAATTALQDEIIAFVRAFGLHKPDQTPCGRPVSVAEAHALMELSQTAPLAQLELGRRLNLEKSTVSRLVGQLEARDWIVRERSTEDRRVMLVQLTERGRAAADDLAAAREAKFAQVLSAIPADQRAHVIESLQTLVEAIRESNESQ